jgi:hypothetical protein
MGSRLVILRIKERMNTNISNGFEMQFLRTLLTVSLYVILNRSGWHQLYFYLILDKNISHQLSVANTLLNLFAIVKETIFQRSGGSKKS